MVLHKSSQSWPLGLVICLNMIPVFLGGLQIALEL